VGLVRRSRPAVEPITVAEAAAHLRLDTLNVEPVPDVPTVALVNPAVAGNVDNGAHRYRLTFVTADGETDGGDISPVVTVADKTVNGKVLVSNIKPGGSLVTARKVYRTKAGLDVYYLVATIADNTTTTYTDNIADVALGAGCPTKNTTSDPTIAEMIVEAREYIETFTRRALISQGWTLTLDGFPPHYLETASPYLELASGLRHPELLDVHKDVIRLPKPPLLTVDEIRYVSVDGASTVLDPSFYQVVKSEVRGEIARAYNQSWPSTRNQAEAVSVDFTCGYGPSASDIPAVARRACRLIVGHLYVNREVFVDNRFAIEVPHGLDSLLWQIRAEEAA
jgi:hypothetical protein